MLFEGDSTRKIVLGHSPKYGFRPQIVLENKKNHTQLDREIFQQICGLTGLQSAINAIARS